VNCLPVVERELRVAARKRSTFWVRFWAATTALVIGTGCLLLNYWQGTSSTRIGSVLFSALTWMCLGSALVAGLFLTSDCLSEEKREGTLGLLFLTQLRGYDVVLGKLLATSLRGAYALLAILPILAITQLMGGVTGAQYWKCSLALINAVWCSLAAGMLISSLSRDSQKALAGALLLLLLLALGGPIADATVAALRKRGFAPFWSLTSPAYVFVSASSWRASQYWEALLTTAALSWTMLLTASALAPLTWQEKRQGGQSSPQTWSYLWKYGGRRRRTKLRASLLEREPVAWLACRERWQSFALWIVALLVCALIITMLANDSEIGTWLVWSYIGGIFTLVLYLWVASQAVRFFYEIRRSGLTELLMVTPLLESEIVAGQFKAFLRMFGMPVLVLLIVQVTGAVFSQVSWSELSNQMNTAATAAKTATSASTNSVAGSTNQVLVWSTTVSVGKTTNSLTGGKTSARKSFIQNALSPGPLIRMVIMGLAVVWATTGNLLALCWFGMWMGLTSRSANLATLKTIVFVQVIPWFVIAFAGTFAAGALMASMSLFSGQPGGFAWWPVLSAVVSTALALLKDIGFIIWARRRLNSEFREQVTRLPGQTRPDVPPIISVASLPA
jgi:ABC-type transport system involved in multi-copper enzyme maturation permease subunit